MGRVLKKATNAGKDYKLTINFGGTHRDILSSFVQKINWKNFAKRFYNKESIKS